MVDRWRPSPRDPRSRVVGCVQRLADRKELRDGVTDRSGGARQPCTLNPDRRASTRWGPIGVADLLVVENVAGPDLKLAGSERLPGKVLHTTLPDRRQREERVPDPVAPPDARTRTPRAVTRQRAPGAVTSRSRRAEVRRRDEGHRARLRGRSDWRANDGDERVVAVLQRVGRRAPRADQGSRWARCTGPRCQLGLGLRESGAWYGVRLPVARSSLRAGTGFGAAKNRSSP